MAEDPNLSNQLAEIASRLDYLENTLGELIARTYNVERHLNLVPPPRPRPETRPPAPQPERPPAPPPPDRVSPAAPPPPRAEPPPHVEPPPRVEPRIEPSIASAGAPPVTPPVEPRAATAARPRRDLESLIGGNWFNRIGIFAIILGAGFFLKYAFDNQWVGPRTRVMIGVLTGLAFLWGGEQMRKRGYRYYAHGLSGGGIAILYLAFFAAFAFYNLIEQMPAFLLMSGVTAVSVLLAARYNALAIAILGLVGGFLTPVLLSTGRDNQIGLFSYLALLNLGVLGLAYFKQWRVLDYLALTATVLMSAGWLATWYEPEKLARTITFFTLLFVIFALIAVFHNIIHRRPVKGSDILLILLNAGIYFGTAYELLEDRHFPYLGLFAVLVSAFYLGLGYLTYSRDREDRYLILTFLGLASLFLTLAVPIQLDQHWVTMGWAIEGVALTWIGLETRSRATLYAALAVFAVGLGHWLMFDVGDFAFREGSAFTPLFNRRGASAAILIAALVGAALLYRRRSEERGGLERLLFGGALPLAANVLAITWLSLDARDYFEQLKAPLLAEAAAVDTGLPDWTEIGRLDNLKHFALTALWSIYGGAMLLAGLARRVQVVRIAALVLLWITYFKVLFFDARYYAASWHTLFFNPTFGAFAVLLVALAAGYWLYGRSEGVGQEEHGMVRAFLLGGANLLAIIALSLEANGYFTVRIEGGAAAPAQVVTLESLKLFTLTALWSVYGAVLLGIALSRRMRWLRVGALALLAITALKLLLLDIAYAVDGRALLFNQTFGAFVILIAALFYAFWLYARAEGIDERERVMAGAALMVAANVLAIFALSFEANDYFAREIAVADSEGSEWREMQLARQLSLSVIWALYGGGMLAVGFWRGNRLLRVMALGLLALTIVKVFLVDLSSLDRVYRIVSFIVLGAILLLVSFLYQRSQQRAAEGGP